MLDIFVQLNLWDPVLTIDIFLNKFISSRNVFLVIEGGEGGTRSRGK